MTFSYFVFELVVHWALGPLLFQTEEFKCSTEFNLNLAYFKNPWGEKHNGIASLPWFHQIFLPGTQKTNVVSVWDPVSLKHIASFIKWQHARKWPETRMSYTRTVNSSIPDAVTGRMSNAARDTGVSTFQGGETMNFVAVDKKLPLWKYVSAAAWRVENGNTLESKSPAYMHYDINLLWGHHEDYTNLQPDDVW